MKYRRICITTQKVDGWTFERGHEYVTSPVKFGTCTAYIQDFEITSVPSAIFAGAERIDEMPQP